MNSGKLTLIYERTPEFDAPDITVTYLIPEEHISNFYDPIAALLLAMGFQPSTVDALLVKPKDLPE